MTLKWSLIHFLQACETRLNSKCVAILLQWNESGHDGVKTEAGPFPHTVTLSE